MARAKTIDADAALRALLRTADEAAAWMCEAREGTDQHERGTELRAALGAYRSAKRRTTACA